MLLYYLGYNNLLLLQLLIPSGLALCYLLSICVVAAAKVRSRKANKSAYRSAFIATLILAAIPSLIAAGQMLIMGVEAAGPLGLFAPMLALPEILVIALYGLKTYALACLTFFLAAFLTKALKLNEGMGTLIGSLLVGVPLLILGLMFPILNFFTFAIYPRIW